MKQMERQVNGDFTYLTNVFKYINLAAHIGQCETRNKGKRGEGRILKKDLDLQVGEEGQALHLVLVENFCPPHCLFQPHLYQQKQLLVVKLQKGSLQQCLFQPHLYQQKQLVVKPQKGSLQQCTDFLHLLQHIYAHCIRESSFEVNKRDY